MGLVINGELIEDRLIQQEAETMRTDFVKAFEDMAPEAQEKQLSEWATDNVIERTLLHQEAIRQNIQVTPKEVDVAVKQLKDAYDDQEILYTQMNCASDEELVAMTALSLKSQKLVEKIRKNAPALSEMQIAQYYQEHAEEFMIPEHLAGAHIVKQIHYPTTEAQVLAMMQQAKAELDQGRPFGMVAEKYSDSPGNGGSLGPVAKGQMVEEFEDVMFHLHPGEISHIFKTRYGYHIATVYDRRPARIADLKDVKKHIETRLKDQIQTDTVYAFIDDLKSKATIEQG